jgi:hypothetical protein
MSLRLGVGRKALKLRISALVPQRHVVVRHKEAVIINRRTTTMG